MSILIKGMKMPKGCTECRFPYDGRCLWGRKSKIGVTNYYPLIELPAQHGRLIDADALVADLKGQVERLFNLDAVSESDFFIERNEKFRQAMWKNWCESFYEYLSARPTIIEAEGASE